ncbi:hypothetical protein GALMADRAFT_147976 [Galerina marginata CBS 339.88]|uniref:Uncharacterized protein n=1 Tax=Galerina marginata (strain CBS 339.88) TaxID=685588 RepID=A0A067SF70_GALM3|nr:hypothetical protein GALMADRAFT_147976 [Galerina marginata CBS 339.88]
MADHLRSDAAQMAGLFVEAVLYGMYVITLGFVLVYIFRSECGTWRRPSGIRVGTLIVALVLGTNSTLNLAWGLARMMQTYIFRVGVKGPTWMDLAKPYTVIIQTLTADLFLTYRCWAVYGGSWRAAMLPVLLSLASLGVFIRIIIIQTGMNSQFGTVSHQVKAALALAPLFTTQFALTTALNVYATSSIAYRIWKADHTSERTFSTTSTHRDSVNGGRFRRLIRIIVDSALIYTAASTMAFASYKSNAQYITSAVDIIAVGIAFNLIIIRLAHDRSRERFEASKNKLTTLEFNDSRSKQERHPHTESTMSTEVGSPLSFPAAESRYSGTRNEKESV